VKKNGIDDDEKQKIVAAGNRMAMWLSRLFTERQHHAGGIGQNA
jgi:hypothetical protein